MWSRASKTVPHEGSDLELDALTNRKPEFLMKEEIWENFGVPPPHETGSCIENRLKLSCIS